MYDRNPTSLTDTVANSEHCNYEFSFFNNDSPKIEDIPRVRLMNRVNLADTGENDISSCGCIF